MPGLDKFCESFSARLLVKNLSMVLPPFQVLRNGFGSSAKLFRWSGFQTAATLLVTAMTREQRDIGKCTGTMSSVVKLEF